MPANLDDEPCLCLPESGAPPSPSFAPGPELDRPTSRRILAGWLTPARLTNAPPTRAEVRARSRDPDLPVVKNGVPGRLALLSVARN